MRSVTISHVHICLLDIPYRYTIDIIHYIDMCKRTGGDELVLRVHHEEREPGQRTHRTGRPQHLLLVSNSNIQTFKLREALAGSNSQNGGRRALAKSGELSRASPPHFKVRACKPFQPLSKPPFSCSFFKGYGYTLCFESVRNVP